MSCTSHAQYPQGKDFPESLAYKTVQYLTYDIPPDLESQNPCYCLYQVRYNRPSRNHDFHLGKISLFQNLLFLNQVEKPTSKNVHKVSVWNFFDFLFLNYRLFHFYLDPDYILITVSLNVQTKSFQFGNWLLSKRWPFQQQSNFSGTGSVLKLIFQ